MLSLPSSAEPIFVSLSVAFSEATFRHVLVLTIGGILTRGPHTITAILRTVQPLARSHFSTYHRVLSRAAWSPRLLQCAIARLVLNLLPVHRPVQILVDETVAEHRGPKVFGKGCHRDGVRSSRKHTSFRWGHKWVVLAIAIRFPFARRVWALPIMAVLYLPKETCTALNRPYKTPAVLARQMYARLIHAFPERKFILVGDGGYASVELAASCARRGHPLVSRLRPDAALYAPPVSNRRRPRLIGRRLDSPRQAARTKTAPWKQARISWYGGRKRRVQWLTGTAMWYRRGRTPIQLRWVYLVDREGQHEDMCLFTTDLRLGAQQIIAVYMLRWSIEVTFEEVRAYLGFETTRQWTTPAVLRAAPSLLGLFTVVSLIFAAHARHHTVRPASTAWYRKESITFSDALTAVRRLLWSQTVLAHFSRNHQCASILPALRHLILNDLSAAA